METFQSFTARRSTASNLPSFQLPQPDHLAQMHKFPHGATTSSHPLPTVASSVLTPPAGQASELSPIASSVNSASSASSVGAVAPYQSMSYWSTPQNPSYSYTSGPPVSSAYAAPPQQQQQHHQHYMGRGSYSPSMNYPNRNPNSPTVSEGLPPPPYDLPPFPTPVSMSGSGGGGHQHLPILAPPPPPPPPPQQHHHQQQQQQQQHQQHLNHAQASLQATTQGLPHAADGYGGRTPMTSTNYPSSSTSQPGSFPAYSHNSPTQPSPQSVSTPSSRISPISAHGQPSMVASSSSSAAAAAAGYQRSYSGYPLPAMWGPIISNMHAPGGQMELVGNMNIGNYPQSHMGSPLYGHHSGQQLQQNDRPFKCDHYQCPQSFNRNHDLKRHKRIHLAVKPYPCKHCEKSFSRKDALKRHALVKGCGSDSVKSTSANVTSSRSQSPKNEMMSDSTSEASPVIAKKELP